MLHFKNAPNINNILKQSFTNATVLSYRPDTYSNKKNSIADQDYPNILIFGYFSDGMGKMLVTSKRKLPTQNVKITGGL